MAARPTNYTAVRALSSQPGEMKKTPSSASRCRRRNRHRTTPTPPNGSRKVSSPDSALFPPESPPLSSLHGAASKTMKTRRPSSGPLKTHDYSLHIASASLPLLDPPSLPNGTLVSTRTPLEVIARTH